jgi:hypothetical protein
VFVVFGMEYKHSDCGKYARCIGADVAVQCCTSTGVVDHNFLQYNLLILSNVYFSHIIDTLDAFYL